MIAEKVAEAGQIAQEPGLAAPRFRDLYRKAMAEMHYNLWRLV